MSPSNCTRAAMLELRLQRCQEVEQTHTAAGIFFMRLLRTVSHARCVCVFVFVCVCVCVLRAAGLSGVLALCVCDGALVPVPVPVSVSVPVSMPAGWDVDAFGTRTLTTSHKGASKTTPFSPPL